MNLVLVRISQKKRYKKGGGSREGSHTFMSNTNCQRIEELRISVEHGRVVTALNIIKH